ncbi:unnamed protein product [Prorocentrum cordatum]|uniref:FACT complex subunit SSRP1 n=1 Tax=Prorocentrum cordatum TaxID=2364126 RepID=A0ABN9VGJ0_9DINO|nr:unnamed protein product [Polarella glacialis]
MEALEIQARPPAEPQQFSEVHLKSVPWKGCAGVALVCLFLQFLYNVRAASFMAQASEEMGHMVELLYGVRSALGQPPPPDPSDDEDDSSGGDEGCAGFYSKGVRLVGFESYCVGYRTDFMTLWTNPGKDSEVYMEFPLGMEFPLRVGVAALSMNGPMAHFDAAARDGDYFLEFTLLNRSQGEDLSGKSMIEIHEVDLSQRTHQADLSQRQAEDDYDALFEAHGVRTLLARLPVLAVRRSDRSTCAVDAVLVDGSPLLGVGLFAIDPLVLLDAQWSIELSTVKSFRGNLDFSVAFDSDLVRFCLYRLPEPVMPPRMADDRVGYFSTDFELLGDYRADASTDSRAFKIEEK